MRTQADYGAAKVACEQVIQEADSECMIIRPGLLGGAGDESGRSGYYPWRFAHPTGDDVLVPPDLTFPVALIDVEDLAASIRANGILQPLIVNDSRGQLVVTDGHRRLVAARLAKVPTVPCLVTTGHGDLHPDEMTNILTDTLHDMIDAASS